MAESKKMMFRLPSGKQVTLNLSPHDTLLEVKTFLCETTELYLYQNYQLLSNGQPLSEYVEFAALNLEDNQIDVKIKPFQETSARYHFKKVQELLASPEKISQLLYQAPKDLIPEPKAEKEVQIPALSDILQGSLATMDQIDPEKPAVCPYLHQGLHFSGFNPPPAYRRLQDEYFYVTFKTTEGAEFQITANANGFFVNSSSRKNFDPQAHPSFPLCKNLLELLQHLSQGLKNHIEVLVKQDPKETFHQNELVNLKFGKEWLKKREQEYLWDQSRDFNDLYGVDTGIYGDWNEDLQLCKSLPKEDFYQRINRDKTLVKIHNDFLKAAIEGAKAVVNGNIVAANPMDPKETQVFIYNQIFFSYAVNTPEHFRQESGQDATFTYSAVNADMRNLNLLHKLDIQGLSLQNTALIDFKGHRVMAQSVVPGILNQESQDQTSYGSMDDGKTIKKDPGFQPLFEKIAAHFYLEDKVQFKNEEGEAFEIAGGLETKGIHGSDKRKYVLDSMRLSPRDVNFLGQDFNCCVIRMELIENYILSQSIEKASQKMVELKKDQESQPKEEPKPAEEPSQQDEQTQDPEALRKKIIEEQKQAQQKLIEQKKKDFSQFQEYLVQIQKEDKSKFKFNSNLHTNVSPCEVPAEQEENLKKLADYLKNVAIVNLIKELYADDTGRLADSKSISEMFHIFGINNRYLGQVHEKIDKELYPNVANMIQKAILVRCIKHVMRKYINEAKSTYLPHTLAHVLNCIFSGSKAQGALNSNKLKYEQEKVQNSKKNKNKKNREKVQAFNLTETPAQIFEMLQSIAQKRYNFALKDLSLLERPFTWLSVLRDVCLRIGLVLQKKNYAFVNQEVKRYQDLPFSFEDIQDILPNVKHIEVQNEDIKYHMELAENLLQQEKLQESADMFQTSMQILINLYGPIKKEIATCYAKQAQIFYKMAKIDQALIYQKLSVQTLKKLYGSDHYMTAHAYLHLGLYYFGATMYKKAEKYLKKSLYYKCLIGGENYPDLNTIMMNLSMVYQQSKQHQLAIDCLLESNDQIKDIFGPQNMRSAGIYQAIAMVHFEIEDFRKAVDYQKKACEIFSQLKTEDPRNIESQFYLKNLMRVMEEKMKSNDNQENSQRSRPIGQNKKQNQIKQEKEQVAQQNQEVTQSEQMILQQKLRIAKMNLKQHRQQRNFKVFN